ncbi:Apyrase [Lucilia cuprina]|nr:Apyrase [Lucilia cuprina]
MIRHKTFGFLLICLTTLLGLSKQQVKADLFPLSIIHINDFHARFEATDTGGGTCNDNKACIGVKRLLEELKDTNAVYFNAGDSFQGTLWYNIGRWNVTSQFLNMLPADAMVKADLFPLSIIHINDFHARFEATDTGGGTCNDNTACIGGYARTVYTVKRLLEELKDTNAVYFNAGDSFQGTLWYNIGRWNVTSQFLNMLPADAMTLGNHEFDHGVEGVVPFLESLNTTMLVANMDSTNEPEMTGKYQKSMIIERSNRKIGVIGVILETTYDLANTGNLIFRNESVAIVEEAEKLKSQGANIIIVISHCGYEVDKLIAEHAGSEIDVIVGSHSHTFLYTGDNPPGPDTPKGDYPTQVTHASGHRVLIVQAGAYAKYVGNLTVYFDDDGNVVDFEGAPIYMSNSVPEDKEIKEFMPTWKNIIETAGSAKIGETIVNLEHTECEYKECNIGNFYTDAMLNKLMSLSPYNSSHWTNVSIALAAAGELYLTLPRGAITYGQVYSLCPFEAPLVAFDLEGVHLKAALEKSVSRINFLNKINATNTFLQVSGLKVIYNLWNPVNKRVLKVKVRCAHCKVPIYENLDINKVYRILTTRYVAGGGYGFSMFKQYGQNRQYGLYNGIHFSVTEALKPWRQEIESVGNRVIGRSAVYLQQKECSTGECNLGNFVTDAMLHAFLEEQNYDGPNWSNITIAFTAQSHFRVPLQPGNITYNHLITMCPWENDIFVSGLKVVYNITNPIGQRVQDLRVRCQECVVPRYVNLDLEKDYKVVLMDYLANGKDGFNLIKENAKDFRRGPGDLDALMKFLKIHDPVVAGIEGRIKVVY